MAIATSEAFPSSDSPLGVNRVARFYIRTAAGRTEVTGYRNEDQFLLAQASVAQPGHAIVVAESKTRAFVLEPEVFNEYLSEEGHMFVLAARAAKGQTNAPGRERYRKIVKTVVCVGEPNDDEYAKPDGLWLELVLLNSPCQLRSGESLTVQALFEGQPLAGAIVAAGHDGISGHHFPVAVRTDAQGRATLRFDRAAPWYVRLHHIVAREKDPEADWESAFSTVTFEVRQ